MENRIYLQPAYVLHKLPFQNSSLLLDFFCVDYGRVRAVARGARREKSKYRALLQVFHPLLVSFSGRGEVKTVNAVESAVARIELSGERLFSGLYINELITRLLMSNVEHGKLFKSYQDALLGLQSVQEVNKVLRTFELSLLEDLGYGIDLKQDCVSRQDIVAEGHYLFVPDLGFERIAGGQAGDAPTNEFVGQHLIELRNREFSDETSRKSARRLLRIALQTLLGEKPLHSRHLFARQSSQ